MQVCVEINEVISQLVSKINYQLKQKLHYRGILQLSELPPRSKVVLICVLLQHDVIWLVLLRQHPDIVLAIQHGALGLI